MLSSELFASRSGCAVSELFHRDEMCVLQAINGTTRSIILLLWWSKMSSPARDQPRFICTKYFYWLKNESAKLLNQVKPQKGAGAAQPHTLLLLVVYVLICINNQQHLQVACYWWYMWNLSVHDPLPLKLDGTQKWCETHTWFGALEPGIFFSGSKSQVLKLMVSLYPEIKARLLETVKTLSILEAKLTMSGFVKFLIKDLQYKLLRL